MAPDDGQLELDFTGPTPAPHTPTLAYSQWQAELRAADDAEARRLGLPLRQRVEVQLECGALLRGRRLLSHPELPRMERRPTRLELRIGDSRFDHSQIARCSVLEDGPPEVAAPPPESARAPLDAPAAAGQTPVLES